MVGAAEWDRLEAWMRGVAFVENGIELQRKSSGPMAAHSIRMARVARAKGHDDVTVFGCYGHDILEDTAVTRQELALKALETFGQARAADALDAVELCVECCYAAEEYAMEKMDRKLAASARWIASPDPRVWQVKILDFRDNHSDFVSDAFQSEYESWAIPLLEGLLDNVARSGTAARI